MEIGQCLMIKTKDRRKFFTHEKNFTPLLEFSKAFKAEISVVKVENAEILDLAQLAPAICDAGYKQPEPRSYEVLEVKLPQVKRNRQQILETARSIKQFIKKQFLEQSKVTLKDLAKTLCNYNLTLACLCNHLAQVRKELISEGWQVEKTGGGKYVLKNKTGT